MLQNQSAQHCMVALGLRVGRRLRSAEIRSMPPSSTVYRPADFRYSTPLKTQKAYWIDLSPAPRISSQAGTLRAIYLPNLSSYAQARRRQTFRFRKSSLSVVRIAKRDKPKF